MMTKAHAAPRCGAKTRSGSECRAPAVQGSARCRMHGGGKNNGRKSGAPNGNQNALKHGNYSAAALAESRELSELAKRMQLEMR